MTEKNIFDLLEYDPAGIDEQTVCRDTRADIGRIDKLVSQGISAQKKKPKKKIMTCLLAAALVTAVISASAVIVSGSSKLQSDIDDTKDNLESIYTEIENTNGNAKNKMSEAVRNADLSSDPVINELDKNAQIIYEIEKETDPTRTPEDVKNEIIEARIIYNAEEDIRDKKLMRLFEILNRSDKNSFEKNLSEYSNNRVENALYQISMLNACCDIFNTDLVKSDDEKQLIEDYLENYYYNFDAFYFTEIKDEAIALRTRIEDTIDLPYEYDLKTTGDGELFYAKKTE